jgi:hypothetical protein
MRQHPIRRASHNHSRTIFPENSSHDSKVTEELLREQNKLLSEIKVGIETIELSIIAVGLVLALKPF